MHVSERNAHDADRHAASIQLHRVSIGASSGRGDIDLVRDFRSIACLTDHLEDDRIRVRTSHDARSFTDVKRAVAGLAHGWVVDGVIDVNGEAGLSIDPECGCACATESDFFLDGCYRVDTNAGV